ncbi:sulfite exporter TauE/SafE family protein [Candidatus Woesebacteria bacterium]|nr:sulfite exporter TauE/SafE family protein [Candidatus Woesebacteria bacterium]
MKNIKTSTLYVAGMHCAACEVLLEKRINKLEGVENVEASLVEKAVTITGSRGNLPNIQTLNSEFRELGYTFTEQPLGTGSISYNNITQIIGIGIVGIIFFIILQDTQLFARFTLTSTSTLPAFFALGVVASISSCAALTGGILLSLTRQWNTLYGGKDESKRITPVILFNIGRLVSYAILGGVLGYIGSFFQMSLQFTSILIIFVSALMGIVGLQMLGVRWTKKIRLALPSFVGRYVSDEQHFQGKYMPFIAGALTFFLPCGFTLMAQSVALTSGSFVNGMLMMLLFAVGTFPVLWFIGYSSVSIQKYATWANTFNVVAAIGIVLFSLYNINAQFTVLGLPSMNDILPHSSTLSENRQLGVQLKGEGKNAYQEVTMEAKGFEYFPKTLTLKAGLPVKLKVLNNGVIGCAAAMYWPGLYNNMIVLKDKVTMAEFTPEKPGNYKVSCTMGMVPPVEVVVN